MVFENRWRAFLNTVILDPQGPVGVVTDYFWRLEYQARGAPHIHMKIWVEKAPIFGVSTNEEVLNFIKKYITCSIPRDRDELKGLVTKFHISVFSFSDVNKERLFLIFFFFEKMEKVKNSGKNALRLDQKKGNMF